MTGKESACGPVRTACVKQPVAARASMSAMADGWLSLSTVLTPLRDIISGRLRGGKGSMFPDLPLRWENRAATQQAHLARERITTLRPSA